MNNSLEQKIVQLREDLAILKEKYSFIGLKGGTETEDMDQEEIRLLQRIATGIVPVTVKIGGPEARTDMRMCISEGINGIVAPMIESEYGLKNFITSLKSIMPPALYEKTGKAINLETITGYRNLLEISDSPWFDELTSVTAARSDLSGSMNLKPDDPEVTRIAAKIIKVARDKKKETSVGGTITINNFEMIAELIGPDKINSRHVVVDTKKAVITGSREVAETMLSFEIDLYDALAMLKTEKYFYYKNRIEINRERIGRKKVVYSIR